MRLKWILFALEVYECVVKTSPSIAGVTYMDNFDFEQRYKDVNECNPFHWHPLHLPEVCADMFEKLIRSKLAKKSPYRIMRERTRDDDRYSPDVIYPERDIPYPIEYGLQVPIKRIPLTPYEKMLELLKKDIKKEPSQPKLAVLPNLGPVAIYNQEVSAKSEAMIKAVATAYGKYVQKSYANFLGYNENMPDYQIYYWDNQVNGTKPKKNKKKGNEDSDKSSWMTRKKTKRGGIVTIVETGRPRHRRSTLYLLGL